MNRWDGIMKAYVTMIGNDFLDDVDYIPDWCFTIVTQSMLLVSPVSPR